MLPPTSPDHEAPSSVTDTAPSTSSTPGYYEGQSKTRYSASYEINVDEKKLWASEAKINAANEALTRAGSYILLGKAGASYENQFKPGVTMFKVTPIWNTARKINLQDKERKRLADANATSTDGFIAHADCFMTAQTVMGVSDSPTGQNNTTMPVIGSGTARRKLKALTNLDMNDKYGGTGLTAIFGGGSPSRGHYAFLLEAFPAFLDAIKDPKNLPPGVDATAAKTFFDANNKYAKVYDKAGLTALIRAYGELRTNTANATLSDAFSKMFGVNEYLLPEVGQGLAVFNDPFERKDSQDEIEKGTRPSEEELWNYHFAGVVMTEGDIFVTFENYSIGNEEADNRDWLFQMYSLGAQSFQTELSSKKGIGKKALTLSFDRTK